MTDSRLGLLYKSDEPGPGLVLTASHGLFRTGVADRIGPDQGSVGAVLSGFIEAGVLKAEATDTPADFDGAFDSQTLFG